MHLLRDPLPGPVGRAGAPVNVPAPSLRLLVCGNADRGDDGAPLCAVAHILPGLDLPTRQRLEVRRCAQLDATDLIDVSEAEACLIVDTVVGVEPGEVVDLSLEELATRATIAPRSSHALPIAQVLGIAREIRGGLPVGQFVGIGGKWFGFGDVRSRALRAGMPAYERAIASAIAELVAARAVAH
jgi:hydrogenase maturation protease